MNNDIEYGTIVTLNKIVKQQRLLINEQKKEIYKLKNILENIPGSVYCKNDKGAYLYCNEFVLEMANLKSYSEIINKTDFDMPWKEYAEEIQSLDKKVIKSQTPLELEEYPTINNKKVVMLTRKTPFRDETGRVTGIIGVSLDITKQKKLEKNLKIAKEKAEVDNQSKTEFLSNMQHDIRTPLTGIIGCAQLVQLAANNPEKVLEYAEDLIESSNALLEFLNRVLDAIKVVSGEAPFLKRKFDFHKQLQEAINLNKSLAAQKNLVLRLDYDEKIPAYLIGDPVRLQRIVLELLTNALTFTQQGAVNMAVKLKRHEARQVIIEIKVCDTGIGIALDKQAEIFVRFKRLTPSYRGIYKGLGLGLTFVKQFINDLGGEIYVVSQLKEGSTFTCLIPFQEPLVADSTGI